MRDKRRGSLLGSNKAICAAGTGQHWLTQIPVHLCTEEEKHTKKTTQGSN